MMDINHKFVPQAFRRLRLPFLLLALIPSLVLEGFIIYGFALGRSLLDPFIETTDLTATLNALAATFMLLQSWLIVAYFRLQGQRARSAVRETERGVIYRKCKLMSLVKTDWKNGPAFNDDIELIDIVSLRHTVLGSLVFRGVFRVVRRAPQTEATCSIRTMRRVVIPAYFDDMDGIAKKFE